MQAGGSKLGEYFHYRFQAKRAVPGQLLEAGMLYLSSHRLYSFLLINQMVDVPPLHVITNAERFLLLSNTFVALEKRILDIFNGM